MVLSYTTFPFTLIPRSYIGIWLTWLSLLHSLWSIGPLQLFSFSLCFGLFSLPHPRSCLSSPVHLASFFSSCEVVSPAFFALLYWDMVCWLTFLITLYCRERIHTYMAFTLGPRVFCWLTCLLYFVGSHHTHTSRLPLDQGLVLGRILPRYETLIIRK